jgi:Lipase (class 3)
MKRLKLTGVATVFAMTMAMACSSEPHGSASHDATDFGDTFEDEDVLAVAIEDSPSGGPSFDFCANTDPNAPVNLHNASWMAFMAANEYAHLGYLAPALLDLGFGNGSDIFWRPCSQSLREVRSWEVANAEELAQAHAAGPAAMQQMVAWAIDPANPDQWHVCAREWAEQTAYDGSTYPAASMEAWLIQETHPENDIQFLSGGAIGDLGKSFLQGGTQAFFARHGEKPVAVFSFRGTEPDQLEDIATDLKAWDIRLSEYGEWDKGWGEVHGGFFEAFETLRVQLDARLDQLEGSGVGIWVTGHSLGGALGTLMTAYILKEVEHGRDLDLRGFYSFGSPRVGDEDFKNRLEGLVAKHGVKVGRVRNHNDIVTHVPGSTLNLLGWRHIGTRIYMTPKELSLPTKQPDYDGLLGLGSPADHSMVGQSENGTPTGYYQRLLAFRRSAPYADAYTSCHD